MLNRALPSTLGLLLLLTGCNNIPGDIATSSRADAPVVEPALFMPPVAVGARVGEPGFRVGPDGTVWVHAPGGLWKSTDNGITFSEITTFGPGPVVGGDADLAIGKDGSLYYTDLQALVAISVFSSHNGAASWFENPLASMVPGDDRQWIEAGPDAGPLSLGGEAVYLVFNHIPTNVFMTKSVDGGKVWVGKNVVLTTSQAEFWSMGNMLIDPRDGTLSVIYSLGNALQPIGDGQLPYVDYRINMSRSMDGGLTWTEVTIVDTEGNSGQIFPTIAQDREGGLYAAWAVVEGDRDLVQMSHSEDRGSTWSAPVTLNPEGTSAVMPWIDVSTPGHAVVAWYQTDQAVLSHIAPGNWFLQMATTLDARNPEAVWEQTRVWDQPVKLGGICTLGIMCDGDRELLDFFQVRIGTDGYPAIVFTQEIEGEGVNSFFTRQLAGQKL